MRYRYPAYVGAGVAASVLAALLGYAQKLAVQLRRRVELLYRAVPRCLLHRHLPALLQRGTVGGQGPLLRAPGRVPGPDRRDDAVRGLGGALGQGPLQPGQGLLLRHGRAARPLPRRGCARDRRHRRPGGRRSGLEGRPDGGAVARAHPGRVHQLGSVRDGARRGRPRRLGGGTALPGRGTARSGRGHQVLPAAVLRGAAAVVPARWANARIRPGLRVRPGRLAGGQPAGRDQRDVELGSVLCVQPGPGGGLGVGLVPVRALQRPGARQLLAGHAEPDVVGVLRPGLRRHRGTGAGGAPPTPAAAALLPAAGRVLDLEQGLVAAVRDLAGAAGGAGQAEGLAVRALAAGRGGLLLRHLGLLREHVPVAGRGDRRLVLRATGRPAAVGRPGRGDDSARHRSTGTGPGPGVRPQ